jgi:hypothetical protein
MRQIFLKLTEFMAFLPQFALAQEIMAPILMTSQMVRQLIKNAWNL